MMWQDWVLGASSLVMCLAFIPTIIGKDKPDRWTAGMFTILLLISASVFITLDLWLGAITQYIGAGEWGITIFQKRRSDDRI